MSILVASWRDGVAETGGCDTSSEFTELFKGEVIRGRTRITSMDMEKKR